MWTPAVSNEPAVPIRGFIHGRYPQHQIADHDDIFALGFVNSLFAMELVVFLEKAFEVTIPNDELRIDNFRTVEVMEALIRRLTPAGSAPAAAVSR
jgi:acyl carrier protein